MEKVVIRMYVRARKIETVLSASEAKKCYHCGETGHMTFKCPHKKTCFSARNGPFACHFYGGIGHKYAKCWEQQGKSTFTTRRLGVQNEQSVATVATDIIVVNMESFETMEFVKQNDVVKVAGPEFEVCCTAIDLSEVMDSKYEIHGKACACHDLVKVLESEYEIHGKACDGFVEVVESEYEIYGKACDNVVEVLESHDEVHSMAIEVEVKNELSDVTDVGGAKAKQGRVSEVVALAPVDTE